MRTPSGHFAPITRWADLARSGQVSRRTFIAQASLFGLSAAAAYGLLGLSAPGRAQAQETPTEGGSLRIAMPIKDVVDPRLFDWPQSSNVARHLCENLVRWATDYTFQPWLLEGWEVNDDATEYVLRLRQTALWTNGDAFTAADVIHNFTRWCDTTVEGNSMAGRLSPLIDDETGQLRKGAVVAEDDHTVRLILSRPDITIIPSLSDYTALIVHRDFDAEGANLSANPVGTGPFTLESHEIAVRAVLKRREEGWWGGRALLEEIVYTDFGTDYTAEVSAFESDAIDLNYESAGKYGQILDDLGLVRYAADTANTIVARFNVTQAPYDDVRVRQALQMSVSNRFILQTGYNSDGIPAENHHVGPMHEEYVKLPPQRRNIERAQGLLAEAGVSDFEFELISIDDDWRAGTCDAIAQQMRQAGINVKRTIIPGASFWNDWTKYPFSATNWAGRPLGVMVLALAYRSGEAWNETGFSDPEFDRILEEALAQPDLAQRQALTEQLEKILQSSGVIIQPYWRSTFAHSNRAVQGFERHQAFEHHMEQVWVKRA